MHALIATDQGLRTRLPLGDERSPEHTDSTAAVLRYKGASQYRRVDGGLWHC